ncbi:MAG: tetratricopeptide repeat protein [Chloroflexota bacterium]
MSRRSPMLAPTRDTGAILTRAVEHHQRGQLADAERLYRKVLNQSPNQPDALHLLGVLALQNGRPADAVTRIQRAIAARPDNAAYQSNLGVALQALGKLKEARASLERAVGLDAQHVDALFNLGVTLQALELLEEAAGRYRQVLALMPGHAGALRNLGNTLRALGQYAEAVEAYRLALALLPSDSSLLGSLGASLADLGQLDEAIAVLEQAVQQAPADADAWMNLGIARHKALRYGDAIAAYERALALRPDHAETWQSIGRAFSGSQRLADAVDAQQQALSLVRAQAGNPAAAGLPNLETRLSVMRDLVSALFVAERRVEASAVLREIIELAPEDAVSWSNLGVTLSLSGDVDAAAAAFERSTTLDPTRPDVLSNLILTLDMLPSTTPEQAFRLRRQWNERHALPLAASRRPHTNDRDPDRRLRVGYVSRDFRRHSAAATFMTTLEAHDPAAVEVFCYASHPAANSDDYTRRFEAAASTWSMVHDLSDHELAEQIRADQIDILVDLSAHSGVNRMMVFAEKPAPVQVTAWGYATGTGLDTVDAFFADPVVVPPEDRRWFSEEVVYLPNVICFAPPPTLPEITPLPALERGHVTFGSYNRAVKITTPVLETWARVLLAVPGSRLVLKPAIEDTDGNWDRLLGPLLAHGIEGDRIEILGRSPREEHVASFGLMDIQLDPFPHTGGITTLEGLLMGVPCVTLLGDRIPGRLSASFQMTLGLGDLVAHSPDEYVEIARRLAEDVDRLARIRSSLREQLLASPIMDAPQYARAVEAAYRDLWRRWCVNAGMPPPPTPPPCAGEGALPHEAAR